MLRNLRKRWGGGSLLIILSFSICREVLAQHDEARRIAANIAKLPGAMRGFVMCVALAGIYFPIASLKHTDAAQEGSSWRKPLQN
jgi:hypothetical protein